MARFWGIWILIGGLLLPNAALAQGLKIHGLVRDSRGVPVSDATVVVVDADRQAATDSEGMFEITLESAGRYTLRVSHVSFPDAEDSVVLKEGSDSHVEITMEWLPLVLEEIQVTKRTHDSEDLGLHRISLGGEVSRELPSALGDFNKILSTLPGVSDNNELGSGYNVRGGNFDENLVYVNEIPIYRPFLGSYGRQGGLSFVNPRMVSNLRFYPGGWEAKYGDKLSSSLSVEYAPARRRTGTLQLGILGSSLHLGAPLEGGKGSVQVGARYRDSRYLLGTLEVEGQYFPTFFDAQCFYNRDLTSGKSTAVGKTSLEVLLAYSRNRYRAVPESQESEFGTHTQPFRFIVAYQGEELLSYDTWQGGIVLTRVFGPSFKSKLLFSQVVGRENENFEVEGAYRLCDILNLDPDAQDKDRCFTEVEQRTRYNYGRNRLSFYQSRLEMRNTYWLGPRKLLLFGLETSLRDMRDRIREYSFEQAQERVTTTTSISNRLEIDTYKVSGYAQLEMQASDSLHLLNTGVRASYLHYTGQWLVSPRIHYSYRPRRLASTQFNASFGFYHQHPFYREFRSRDGQINPEVRAQKSWHVIAGVSHEFKMFNKPFLLTSQAYYKHLYDLVPYDLDNVKLRYFAKNSGHGFAAGLDIRLHGEFIAGKQSWISLGILKTNETIEGFERRNIRRPLDQRINLGIYFEDHIPQYPTWQVYLNFVFGSGFPVGPPGNPKLRNTFKGDRYYRTDLGLAKLLTAEIFSHNAELWFRLEMLNALGAYNKLSYLWIETANGTTFAVPNALTSRFVNFKIIFNLI